MSISFSITVCFSVKNTSISILVTSFRLLWASLSDGSTSTFALKSRPLSTRSLIFLFIDFIPCRWHDKKINGYQRILDRWIAFDNSWSGSNKNIQKPNLWPSFKHLFQPLLYEKQCQGTFERLTSLIPPPLGSTWVCPAGQTRHPPPCKLKRMIYYCCWSKAKNCRCPLEETPVWTCYHQYM